MQPVRFFNLQEANAALTAIRPLMEEIQVIRQRILSNQPEIWPAVQHAAGNGGGARINKIVAEFDRLNDLVHQILSTGAEIKDLNTGLLDFRAWRADREVYLCWQYGENEIGYWHDLDAGFAGRQPIDQF